MRSILILAVTILVAAALMYVAAHLYQKDFLGTRTAVAKRHPENHARQDLSGQDFRHAFQPYANFQQTKLHETILSDADLRFADFSDADFEMAGVDQTNFSNALFLRAKLQNARWLDSAIYQHANFRDTDLTWVSFHGLYGQHLRSKPRHMMDPGAGGADMTGAIFDGARCNHAVFSRCILTGASFKGADCREAHFTNADLKNADFTGADIRGAKLEGADLTGAIFTNAKRD